MGNSGYADNLRVIYQGLPKGSLRNFIASGLKKLPGRWRLATSASKCIFCSNNNDGMVMVSYPNFPLVHGYIMHDFHMCKKCEESVTEAEELLDNSVRNSQLELFDLEGPLEYFIQTGQFMEEAVTYNICLPDLRLAGYCCFCSSPIPFPVNTQTLELPVNYQEQITQAKVRVCLTCFRYIKSRLKVKTLTEAMQAYYIEENCADCNTLYWITRDEELYRSFNKYKQYTCSECTAKNVWRAEAHPMFYRDIPGGFFMRLFVHHCVVCETEVVIDSLKKKQHNIRTHYFDNEIYCTECTFQREPCIFYKKVGDKVHRIFPTVKDKCYHTISTNAGSILSRNKIPNKILADEITRLSLITYNLELFNGST